MYSSKPVQGDRTGGTACHHQRVHEQGGGVCTSQGGRVWAETFFLLMEKLRNDCKL